MAHDRGHGVGHRAEVTVVLGLRVPPAPLNIKERRDCSTALFDERGRMIAQAEHIPVHLGAMPDAVAAVMRHDPAPGDVFILNDPYAGGTHLPT